MHGALETTAAPAEQSQRDLDGTDLLRQIDICRQLGISDETWRRWRARGLTPEPVDMPGVLRWRREDIQAFATRRRNVGPKTRHYFASARRSA